MPRRLAVIALVTGLGAGVHVGVAQASTGWTLKAVPKPPGSASGELYAVSCSAASACTAVGDYTDAAGVVLPLAERWNGHKWVVEATADPSGATGSYFDAVSCPSASACTAVGYYVNGSGLDVTMAEAWNGTRWVLQAVHERTGTTTAFLEGVSCRSAAMCVAVGWDGGTTGTFTPETLAVRWDGVSWAIQSTPVASQGSLNAVSCSSPTACTAVGAYESSAHVQVTLAERWNGTHWTIEPTQNPAGATDSILSAVSCPTASMCSAVGNSISASNAAASVAEHWNGTSWSIVRSPGPTGAVADFLSGVSCQSSGSCTAVGWYDMSSGPSRTLAEGGSGTSWSVQRTPDAGTGLPNWLQSVACSSPTTCTAVGKYNTGDHTEPLAERD